MNDFDFLTFAGLFNEAYLKCFGYVMDNPLTETESKIFCNRISEKTGLSIGWKSVKNYSFFIKNAAGKKENPSVATMDTLARYILGAPYTTEIQRKNDESHYPYWFLYKEKFPKVSTKSTRKRWRVAVWFFLTVILATILLVIYIQLVVFPKSKQFTDYFNRTDENTMRNDGWSVKSKDSGYWNRRNANAGELTLFTLQGDNWPDPLSKPGIKNLLLREIPSDCFTAEVHIRDFIPKQEWQQAGILLLEDTSFTGKNIRLSLAYNDYFGGMKMPPEILIQAITSLGGSFGKPEEIAHKPIFYFDDNKDNQLLIKNLANSALRIEKHGNKYRFLYANGTSENTAFKEIVTQDFDMNPKYIGLFAIKGFTNSDNIPVRFKFFRITSDQCH